MGSVLTEAVFWLNSTPLLKKNTNGTSSALNLISLSIRFNINSETVSEEKVYRKHVNDLRLWFSPHLTLLILAVCYGQTCCDHLKLRAMPLLQSDSYGHLISLFHLETFIWLEKFSHSKSRSWIMAKIHMHAFMTGYGTYEMGGDSRGGINFIGPRRVKREWGGAGGKSEYGWENWNGMIWKVCIQFVTSTSPFRDRSVQRQTGTLQWASLSSGCSLRQFYH